MRYKMMFTFLLSTCLLAACSKQGTSTSLTTTLAESTTTTTSCVSTSFTQGESTSHSTTCATTTSSVSTSSTQGGNTSHSTTLTTTTQSAQDQPFSDIDCSDINSITLHTREGGLLSSSDAVDIGSITDEKEILKVYEQLTTAQWKYFPTEYKWLKAWPVLAKHILIFHLKNQKQLVLHIPYEESNYISIGLFDEGKSYQSLYKQALQDYRNGNNHFKRYTSSRELVDYLCDLVNS